MKTGKIEAGWSALSYREPPKAGLYWLRVATPIIDCDVDDYGQPIGWPTGEIAEEIRLAILEIDPDGLLACSSLDTGTFCATLRAPDLDAGDVINAILPAQPPAPDAPAWRPFTPEEGNIPEELCWVRLAGSDAPLLCSLDLLGDTVELCPAAPTAPAFLIGETATHIHPLLIPSM